MKISTTKSKAMVPKTGWQPLQDGEDFFLQIGEELKKHGRAWSKAPASHKGVPGRCFKLQANPRQVGGTMFLS